MSICLLNKFDLFVKNNIVFCDKNFKYIRFAADYMSSVCLSLVYRIIAVAVSFEYTSDFKNRDRHYISLAECEDNKILALKKKFFIFQKHGSEIVDFSENGGLRVDQVLLQALDENDFCLSMTKLKISQSARSNLESTHVAELQALKRMYGSETIDDWADHFQVRAFLHRDRTMHGCCSSMTLDFISSYLQQIKAGKAPLESIKAIAPNYAYGASKNAQIAQIFYSAVHQKLRTHYVNRLDQLLEFYKKKSENIIRLPMHEQSTALRMLTTKCHEKGEKLKDNAKLAKLRVANTIEKAFGIAAQSQAIERFFADPSLANNPSGFENFIRNLPAGVYKVDLNGKEAADGHSLAFIKSANGEQFIFDPNFATFAVSPADSATRIMELAKMGKYNKFSVAPFIA